MTVAQITQDHRLTSFEAADRLGVSRPGVMKMVFSGRLPATRCALGWLFDPEDVDRLAEERSARQASQRSA